MLVNLGKLFHVVHLHLNGSAIDKKLDQYLLLYSTRDTLLRQHLSPGILVAQNRAEINDSSFALCSKIDLKWVASASSTSVRLSHAIFVTNPSRFREDKLGETEKLTRSRR